MKIKCWIIGFACVLLFSCKANSLIFKTKIKLDENTDNYYTQCNGFLIFENNSNDTLRIPKKLNIYPKDWNESRNTIELFYKNEAKLDTLKGNDVHITINFLALYEEFITNDYHFDLSPGEIYKYQFDLSLFYDHYKEGTYLYKICFEPLITSQKDTCIIDEFIYVDKEK